MVSLLLISCMVLAQEKHKSKDSFLNPNRQEGFYFTNPLLDCESSLKYIPPFKQELQKLADANLKAGKAERISIYFRQLNNGYSFGINENWKYSPASLLKVGDLMYVLKKVQSNPELLQEEFLYSKRYAPLNDIKGMPTRLTLGKTYSLAELLIEMIVHSDNESIQLIQDRFQDQLMWKKCFTELGIPIRTSAGLNNIISPKEYSALFRVLYNASYLNREMSGVCLDLLCKTTFNRGILAGIGNDQIQIANKYGLRRNAKNNQLHETAIVYLNHTPYLLSIMTEGANSDDLVELIKNISAVVFNKCLSAIDKSEAYNFERSKANTDVLVSPLLDCSTELDELESFAKKIRKYVAVQTKKDDIEQVSLYFRHLANGRWFSINKDSLYTPASLMKLPHMIALFKAFQKNPKALEQFIEYDRFIEQQTPNIPDKQIQLGNKYSIINLLERMIIYSDNLAAQLLFSKIEHAPKMWNNLFDDLGITQWRLKTDTMEGAISVQDISLMFRVLYNATYLNREFSERALSILSQTRYKEGIRKGLDEEMVSALKFGERSQILANNRTIFQLHDCGIVYYENNPYLLCIMTKGDGFEVQSEVIQNISRMIYEEMKEQFPANYNLPSSSTN